MSRELWEIVRADQLKVGDVAIWGSPDEYEEFKIISIKPVVDEDGKDMEEIEFGIGPSISTDLGKGERVFRRVPDAERHANLFAAAPEMYEALKYIRENCFIYHDSSMDIDDEAGRLADAALAKAKGGSNVS